MLRRAAEFAVVGLVVSGCVNQADQTSNDSSLGYEIVRAPEPIQPSDGQTVYDIRILGRNSEEKRARALDRFYDSCAVSDLQYNHNSQVPPNFFRATVTSCQ